MVQDATGIAMGPVKGLRMRNNSIIPASDIQDTPGKIPLHEGGAADGVRLACFGD